MERGPPKTDHPSLLPPVALFTGPIGFTRQTSALHNGPLAFQSIRNNSGAATLAAQPLNGTTICQIGPGSGRPVLQVWRDENLLLLSGSRTFWKRYSWFGCGFVSQGPAESAAASVLPLESWTFPPSLCSPDRLRLKNYEGLREHSSARPSVTWLTELEDKTSFTLSARAERSLCF